MLKVSLHHLLGLTALIKYLLIFFSINLIGQIELSNLFTDNMVLQRNSNVNIWGKSSPNKFINIFTSWNNINTTTKSDNLGKWNLKIETNSNKGPHKIIISSERYIKEIDNVLLGEVWFASGQSNMEMSLNGYVNEPINGSEDLIAKSENSNIRLLTVKQNYSSKPLDSFNGEWKVSNPKNVRYFSAVAYSFAKYITESLDLPVGIIVTAWGGTPAEAWVKKSFLDKNFEAGIIKNNDPEKLDHHNPGYLYNAMLNPLIPFTVRGGIWYQGENNRVRAKHYSKLMNVMIHSWREEWGIGEFPFYFVQIAPFRYDDANKFTSAELREAQLEAMKNIENSGMVSTVDIGDLNSIHPPEKIEVGNRLAYWALNKTYGFESITPSGPIVKSAKINGSSVKINFDYAQNGFYNFNGPLKDFELAGDDDQYYTAIAKISGRSIIVESENVPVPTKVRYGWKNYFEATLFNLEGLPASSFQINSLD